MICKFKGDVGGEPAVHREHDCPKDTICKNNMADTDDDFDTP